MPRVAFLCKGTKGDVLPLLSIALRYRERHKESKIVFACAPTSLSLPQAAMESLHDIQIWPLPDQQAQLVSQAGRDRESLLKLTQDEERQSVLKTEVASCLHTCQEADLIVFNLFSLEGFFIAQHLGLPSIAASPHLLTRSLPSGFEPQLAATHPQLYQKLKAATQGEEVSYPEVDHWMWRLFLDDYGTVCESLGLPAVPLSLSPNGQLPPPTPLLYGISPSIIPRQPYWPDSVSLCGYWVPPSCLQPSPDPALVGLIQSITAPLLYVGFGSMELFLLDMNWTNLFATLEEVLESHAMEAVFQCTEGGPVSQVYSTLQNKPKRIHIWPHPLPHLWLFPQCSVVLHHGGSGTVATSLLCQNPQIISPVMFDQSMWAEQLSWEGVAYQCPAPGQLTPHELSHALRVALGEGTRRRVRELSAKLLGEDGVKAAVEEIEKALARKQR